MLKVAKWFSKFLAKRSAKFAAMSVRYNNIRTHLDTAIKLKEDGKSGKL